MIKGLISADPADGKGERVRKDITISQGQERSKLQEPERGKQTKEESKEQTSKAEAKEIRKTKASRRTANQQVSRARDKEENTRCKSKASFRNMLPAPAACRSQSVVGVAEIFFFLIFLMCGRCFLELAASFLSVQKATLGSGSPIGLGRLVLQEHGDLAFPSLLSS